MDELERFLFGKWLGKGVYREVWQHAQQKDLVIKKANEENGREVNFIEHRLWRDIEYNKSLKPYFAPVVAVSDCGKYLIQKKVEPLPKRQYPKVLPAFFTDTKYSNFGLLNGKFVCIDYGCLNIWATTKLKLKKVDWWE